MQEKVKQARLNQQIENVRLIGAVIDNILVGDSSGNSASSGYSSAEERMRNSTQNPSGVWVVH